MTTLADELIELRRLKDEALAAGTVKTAADAAFKQQQAAALNRMEAEQSRRFGTDEYLYTANTDRVKGQVSDRKAYVRHELENDPAIIQFLDEWTTDIAAKMDDAAVREFEAEFYEAIMSTSTVKYKEDRTITNAQAKAHVDDEAPMPPGLEFRPDPYIGMTAS